MECVEQVAVRPVVDAHVAPAVNTDQQQVEAVEHHRSDGISTRLNGIHLHMDGQQIRNN